MTRGEPDELLRLDTAARALADLCDADLASARALLRVRDVPRDGYLLRAGQRATHGGFVLAGALREFYVLASGAERTKGFAQEGEFVGSLSDLLANDVARASISAETDARLLVIEWRAFESLCAASAGWERFARRLAERLYLQKSQREWELLALDAAARYALFPQRFPGLEARVPQHHVASYIGVTPEHLSRLRREVAATAAGAPRSTR